MNPIVKLAASALPGEKKYVLFVGAGVSKDAGVPSAWDLMLKTASLIYASDNEQINPEINLEEWFVKSKYANMEYSELIEKIYPKYPDQQSFLKEYLTKYEIGAAHYGIAELARRGIIRTVITTNFDHFIEKALEEKGFEVQVISTEEDLKNSEPLIHCKAIRVYKPHGSLGRGALKNTPKDLEKLPELMEQELIRVISEHGIVVLGYSGIDKGIQEIFKKRNYTYYPLFWVDPNPPKGEIENILNEKDFSYIPCTGASQFINDYLRLLERLQELAPSIGIGPTISDLKHAFNSSREIVGPLYEDYVKKIHGNLEKTKPDFSKFDELDEAIIAQINDGQSILYNFVEATLLSARYNHLDTIMIIYRFFEKALKLYDVPDGFSGSYRTIDFDGFKFLTYEMFVTLVASLIKNNRWEILGEMLSNDLFIDKKYDSKYVPFEAVNKYVASLDDIRNKRLSLRRISVMADLIKDRYTQSELASLIDHREFVEADYFLFMRTVCYEEDLQYLATVWCPRSCVWLDRPPSYIVRAESKKILNIISEAAGFKNAGEFVERFKKHHHVFERYFRSGFKDDPLSYYDLNKLGTRE